MFERDNPISNNSLFFGLICLTTFLLHGVYSQPCIPIRERCDLANSTGVCCPNTTCSFSQAGGHCQPVHPNPCAEAEDRDECHDSVSEKNGTCCYGKCITEPGRLPDFCRIQHHPRTGTGNLTPIPTPIPSPISNPTIPINMPTSSPTNTLKTVDKTEGSGLTTAHVIGIVFGSITVALLGIIIVVILVRRTTGKKQILTEREAQQFLGGTTKPKDYLYIYQNTDSDTYDKNYEVPEKDFLIDYQNVLGSGAFGIVLRGVVRGKEIAAKTMRPNPDPDQVKALLSELKVIIYVGKHPNIVSLIGASTTKLRNGSVFIFMEFCSNGSLWNYLQTHKEEFLRQLPTYVNVPNDQDRRNPFDNPTVQLRREEPRRTVGMSTIDMLTWSVHIASGMKYLSDKKVIHADLACRNVLLTDKFVAKITDFGLSRKLYDYTNYVKTKREKLPWAWMAIESLRQSTFSSQSDVWSFGITLWEIFSLGATPHQGFNWSEGYIECILKGMRLSQPEHAIKDVYEVMTRCWQIDPIARPTFSRLHTDLLELSSREAGYIDLNY